MSFFHTTVSSNLNPDNNFKSRVLLKQKERIKVLTKDKEDESEIINV